MIRFEATTFGSVSKWDSIVVNERFWVVTEVDVQEDVFIKATEKGTHGAVTTVFVRDKEAPTWFMYGADYMG